MTAWANLVAKSTAPNGSTAWEHLISQAPGGGPVTGVTAFTGPGYMRALGYHPAVDTGGATQPQGTVAFTGPGYTRIFGYPPHAFSGDQSGGPCFGVNAVMPPTAELEFTGYSVDVLTPTNRTVVPRGNVYFGGTRPEVVHTGPCVVSPVTGSMLFGSTEYSRDLAEERTFDVDEDDRMFFVAGERRYWVVETTVRFFIVDEDYRYIMVPGEEVSDA